MTTSPLPTIITSAGLQPQTPASLLQQLLTAATAAAPGLTVLPAALIEDVSSTQVAGIALIDAARVEFFNSLTPYTANPYILNQLGVQAGVLPGMASNTSVYVVFTDISAPGLIIAPSTIVSDGTNQYVCPDGGVIGSGGSSLPIYAVCTTPGSFTVPANTVTTLITSPPTGYTITVTNPQAGTPGAAAQSEQDYRTAVLQAGLASAQGMPRFFKTIVDNVPGVQPRLVAVQQAFGLGYTFVVGGGDQYQVAYAIYQSMFDTSRLVPSVNGITGITNANPGVVSTALAHGYTTGQTVTIAGVVGMTGINTSFTATVISANSFSIGFDTTSVGAYVSGGSVSPNARNLSVSLYDSPDTYVIPIVVPFQQNVTMAITWNTIATNYVSPAAVTAAVQPQMTNYINSIPVGQPMNLFEMQAIFQMATAALVPNALLTRMVFVVAINGVTTAPTTGTGVFAGDPQSYFYATPSSITVTQG